MKRKMYQRVLCFGLSLVLLFGSFSIPAFAASDVERKTNAGSAAKLEDMVALLGTSTYEEYSEQYDAADFTGDLDVIEIPVTKFEGDGSIPKDSADCVDSAEQNIENWTNFSDEDWENTVYLPTTDAEGKKAASTTWRFNISKEQIGLYYLQLEFYNCKITVSENGKSSVSAIQRKLKIDGKVPFKEVSSISLDKHWAYKNITVSDPAEYTGDNAVGTYVTYGLVNNHKGDEMSLNGYYKYVTEIYEDGGKLMEKVTSYKISQDINGNSMTPEIGEESVWGTYICKDTTGYYDGYFTFLFGEEREYTITLEAEREPMILKSIKLVPINDESGATILSYDEYSNKHADKSDAKGGIVTLQAEFPDAVSDASVAPANNNSSAVNYPLSPSAQLFNVVGETGYSAVGQWAAYKFTVNESGMYNLAARYKQETLQGMFACRTIKLAGGEYGLSDGSPTVPFSEAQNVRFSYSKEWQSEALGDYIYKNEAGELVDINGYSYNSKNGLYVNKATGVEEKLDGQHRPFELYFEEGVVYTLYVECSLGDLKSYIQRAEVSLANINDCYLRILQRTGSDPDVNADYSFDKSMPDVLVTLLEEAIELTKIADELEALCGTNGAHLATLDTIARILDIMGSEHGRDIAANMGTLKSYLGTLGTWINDSKKGVIMLDSISVVPTATEESMPKAKAGFFTSIWYEISSFIYSFFTNYDQMGLTVVPTEDSTAVSVWLAMGRDQSLIWRSMVDAKGGFTDTYGTAVTLKLVTGGTLLPSILSGKGPDVYLGLGSSDVINYAIRSAVIGISGNDSKILVGEDEYKNIVFRSYIYENESGERVFVETEENGNVIYRKPSKNGYDVMSQVEIDTFNNNKASYKVVSEPFKAVAEANFAPAAMNTLTLLEVSYGLPMIMSFAMMFYRMDVLGQLGLEVPESWDELLAMLPVLQTNNMSMGVSYISALDFMMYQQGGNMWKYTDASIYDPQYAGSKIDLDSPIALEAFEFVCRLYTDYSFPVSFDSANRFRTGEMPIVIGDYASIYNTLVVYATEIEGLWEFCPLPGSDNPNEEDGFNYDSLAGVSATVILNGCDDLVTAWQFAQWQTSASVQADYGNKIVALIGPAAKYETANLNAIDDLSWTAREKAAIKDQMANLDAIVNYPGSYIYSRYMKFAFLDAYNDGADPYEAMMSYISAINDEIARKRSEFDLPIAESEEEALRVNQSESKGE